VCLQECLYVVVCLCESAIRGYVGDPRSRDDAPGSCQLSDDCNHHHYQAIYNRLTDGVDDSGASSIDIQFHSSANSSLASQLPQLSRWKPVSNIPERWSKEMSDNAAATGYCELVTYMYMLDQDRQQLEYPTHLANETA